MIDFVTYLEEDSKGEKWITIMHRHVKIDGNGNIIAGLGGKFNGQHMQKAMDHLASPEGSKKNKATEEKSPKKTKQALSIIKNNPDLSSKELKDIFMKNLGMTPGQASVYLSIAKKKIAKASEVEKPEEKEPLKIKTKEKKKISLDSKEEPEEKKEEPKKDEKEKSSKKLHQAIDIFKSMPNATSKEVQAKFKSQIGMTPGMAAVYYHKIKKQFGNTEAQKEEPKVKNVDDTIHKEYTNHVKLNGPINFNNKDASDKLYDVFKKVKALHPEMQVTDIASKLSKYHHDYNENSTKTSKNDNKPKGNEKSVEDQISQYVKSVHKDKQGIDIIKDIKIKHDLPTNKAQELYKKYKKQHAEEEAEQHVGALLQLKHDKEAISVIAKEMNLPLHQAQEYWENHPKVKEFNDKAGKHVADQYEKYQMGLKTQSQALKNVSDELGVHFTKAEELWADHKNKAESDSIEKQKTADKIFADGKKQGLKYSEIASKIKKTLGYPANVIKYIDNAEKNHDRAKLDAAYDDFKYHEYMGHDDVTKASTLQAKHGYSYDDSWDALEKLKTHHEKQSKDHFQKAVDLINKNKKYSYGEHVDEIGKQLGLNPYHAEQMTSQAKSHIKNEQKDTAIGIYKKIKSWGGDNDEVIDHIKSTLDVDDTQATKLFNLAKNTVADEKASGVSYKDVKSKVSEHNGGAKVFYNHEENTHEIEPEHVKVYHRKVELAKKVYGHDAFTSHDHLMKPTSLDFYKIDQKKKDMSQAIYDYTGSHYHDINMGLRQGSVYSSYAKTVKNMDKAYLDKSAKTTKDTVVYRGYTNTFANSLEPGDILEDKGFMSTSADQHKAENWASSDGAVVHILLPKGSNALTVAHLSQHGTESEILLNRGAKLRIVKKEERKNSWGEKSGVTLYAEYLLDESHSHTKEEKPKRKYTKKKVDNQE